MDNTGHKALFRDYYTKNMGEFYKSFQISINDYRYNYDIYWGEPDAIFDARDIKEKLPLAVTIISRRKSDPNNRIYLHKEIDAKSRIFEMIVVHEIGHLWLHDIVGFNNPTTNSVMDEVESESWADYFSYCFLVRHRKGMDLKGFLNILLEATEVQRKLYRNDERVEIEDKFSQRISAFEIFENRINDQLKNQIDFIIQMKRAIDITLDALGDIFR